MITDLIKSRRSVRSFDPRPIEEETLANVQEYIENIPNPFNIPVEFKILEKEKYNLSSPVLVGDKTYIAAKTKKQPNAELAYGYSFEKLVLFAQSLNLGTVWIAGTMARPAFEKAMEVTSEEFMPAATPIGYIAEKMSVRETMMRKGVKADKRADFETLFFAQDFDTPLLREHAGKLEIPLEMVRLAPSAVNKQPWRVVISGNNVHFYEQMSKGYINDASGDIQKLDLGIALCHFELAAQETGLKGKFTDSNPNIQAPENCQYIISFELE